MAEGDHDGAPAGVRWGMGDAIGGMALSLTFSILVTTIVISALDLSADEFDDLALWGVALLQVPLWAGLVGVPLYATYAKGDRSLRRDFGLWMERRDAWFGPVVGLTSQFGLALLLIPLYDVLGVDRGRVGDTAESLTDRADDLIGIVLLFLVVVVGAGVFEELFYRGLVLRSIQKRFGDPAAVLGSGLVFGLMHFNAVETIPLVLFGFILGWLAVRSGRLGPGIWAHMAFNTTTLVSLLLS